jgi:hypothetical protein
VTMFDQPYIEHCRKNRKKPSDWGLFFIQQKIARRRSFVKSIH